MLKFEIVSSYDAEPHYSNRDLDLSLNIFVKVGEDNQKFSAKGVLIQDRDHRLCGEFGEIEIKDSENNVVELEDFNHRFKTNFDSEFQTWYEKQI